VKKERYKIVKLPVELIEEIDLIRESFGYRSRAEFVKEAVRRLLNEYRDEIREMKAARKKKREKS